ncbi:MAG: DUF4040 domain-containing protein [Lachnospiraceae bacterium]|nr:DUF4040 domain-containing protein [Lachnospiraceae bacterium]
MTNGIILLLVSFLVVCAIAVSFTKNLLVSVIIYMSYSLVMSVVWIFLESPDLAITEAAVGAGITSVLFFVTLRKIDAVEEQPEGDTSEQPAEEVSEQPAEGENAALKDTENAPAQAEAGQPQSTGGEPL